MMFGVNKMDSSTYEKECKPWYDTYKDTGTWCFKDEMITNCRADVELSSKAVQI